jgi:hypothetical protein
MGGVGAVITPEERRALRSEVERFARRCVEPGAGQPDGPASPVELEAILAEAESLGLAGSAEEPTGLGPWEGLADNAEPGASLDTLAQLARANAATALAVHQRSLARAACRLAELPGSALAPLAIAPQGSYGLGRVGIARWLSGAAIDDGDRAILDDIYGTARARVVTVEHGFAGMVAPVRAGDPIQWRLDTREALSVAAHEHAHGMDELTTATIALPESGEQSTLSAARSREVFAAITGAHQLALVAIARGAVERGLGLARSYAAERYQGGAVIDRHPAVLALLGTCRSQLAVVDAQLYHSAGTRLCADGLVDALAMRARAMPALADAANCALQVFGGSGYMRDVGAEKVVRDTNHLRAIGGPLGELELIVAEWERLRDV